MRVNLNNQVLEDIISVCLATNNENIEITDKTDKITKTNEGIVIPLVLCRENIYRGYEKKILHYYDYIDHYNILGIENVEQYLCLILHKNNKGPDYLRRIGKYINEYITQKEKITKLGFHLLGEYIEYRLFCDTYIDDKSQNFSKTEIATLFSIKKEYESDREDKEELGIYTFNDYISYNRLFTNAILTYENEGLEGKVSKEAFVSFELREFGWRKGFKEQKGSLKNVQKYIRKKYLSERSRPDTLSGVEVEYLDNPAYYYEHYAIRNITEYNHFILRLREVEDRYISLKSAKKINISKAEYLRKELLLS